MRRALFAPPGSPEALRAFQDRSNRTPKDAKVCTKFPDSYVANGIAIVTPKYAKDVSGCLRQRPTKKTLDDTLSLVDGQVPTFLSFACRHHRNKRQQKEHARRMYLKSTAGVLTCHKCPDRQDLERDGGILIMDGYLNRNADTTVAEISSPYCTHFESQPPHPNRRAAPRLRLSKMTKYLVDEAVLGHRPVFERVPTSEVYGDGCDYTTSVEALAEAEVVCKLLQKTAFHPVDLPHIETLDADIVIAEIGDFEMDNEPVSTPTSRLHSEMWSPANASVKHIDSSRESSERGLEMVA